MQTGRGGPAPWTCGHAAGQGKQADCMLTCFPMAFPITIYGQNNERISTQALAAVLQKAAANEDL